MKIKQKAYNLAVFLFIWGLVLIMPVLAQEPLPAANKSEILRYREQQDIFSNDLQGLGYSEAAQIIKDETSSETKLSYYYKQGKDYFDNGQYEKALMEFNNALDWNRQYKPALKYVGLIEEKMRQQQQLKKKEELAEKKTKEEEERRQENENARLSREEKAKYEQSIKFELEQYRNFKKLNEAKLKDVLDGKLKQYESEKKIQEELSREREKAKAKNAGLETIARLKAEKEQSEKFLRMKLAKEKEAQLENLEQNKRLAEQQKEKDLAERIAVEEILSLEREKAKHEQFIKLGQEKSKNFKKLNEAGFREKLSQKLKKQDLVKQSRKELLKSQNIPEVKGLETAITQATPDSLELSKIQQGFEDKYTKLFRENEAIKKDYNNLLAQVKELLVDSDRAREFEALLEKNNSALELYRKENERVKKDYNNLLLQVKMLLIYRQRIKKLEGLLEDNKINITSLGREKEVAILEKNELKRRNKEIEQSRSQLLKDRDSYKEAYEKLKDTYEKLYSDAVANKLKVKEYMNDTPLLVQKNKDMEAELKQLRDENGKTMKDYEAALLQLKELMRNSRRAKGLEDILAKSKADLNSLTSERDALKAERSRVLFQMKGLLRDRRRAKKLESLLEESNAEIKTMQKENETAKKGYNSLSAQVKALVIDKNRLKDIEEILEKNKADMSLLVKDSEAVKEENAKLKGKIKQFENEQVKLFHDRDKYKTAYENARNDTAVKELKIGISNLEKEKSGFLSQLKQAQEENETVKKEYNGLLAQVNDLLADKKRLKELEGAVEKNQADKSLLEKDNKSVKAENLELKDKIKGLESLQAQASQARDETVMKNLKQIQKENVLIKKDYALLLAQMKGLLADSRRVKEMETLLEKNKVSIALLQKENESAKVEYTALKGKAGKPEELQKKLAKPGQDKGAQKEFSNESSGKRLKIKEFKAEDINPAKNDNDKESVLKQTDTKDAQLKELNSKFDAEKEQLSNELEKYKKKYSQELEKNNTAAREKNNLPQKFSDVVNKNEALIKETAGMHYNLGVFFIKNSEYDRAVVEFEKAIEMYPEDPYSYYNLGYIYAQYLSDRKKAVKYFRQFLQFVNSGDKDAEWVKDYLLTWEAYK